jgi:hypothetical protein
MRRPSEGDRRCAVSRLVVVRPVGAAWRMQGVLLLCGGHQKVIGDVPLAGWW